MNKIIIPRFFIPHVHLRESLMMKIVAPMVINNRLFSGATAMGNTALLIKTIKESIQYKSEAYALVNKDKISNFDLIVPIILNRNTKLKTIDEATKMGKIFIKFLPDQTSTGAHTNVKLTDTDFYFPLFKHVENYEGTVLIHPEINKNIFGKEISLQNRERAAVPIIEKIAKTFPKLNYTPTLSVEFIN